MSSFQLNKIFAAVLVAGITAMLAGFVSHKLIHPHELEKDAVEIDGGVVEGVGGAQAVAKADPIMHLLATADIAQGEKLSKACAACHSFDKGGPHKIGPNMWNVVGAPKGAKSGFEYSAEMKEFGGAWGYLELNKFLWKPKSYIAGTKMNYIGLKNPEKRAAMIAWMRTLADSLDPLPSQAEIEKEKAELAPPEPVETEESSDEGAE